MNKLYSLAQILVDKYNVENDCNLKIQRHSENGFSLPYIHSDKIYIDKSVHVWLALYFFGNPNLFILKSASNLNGNLNCSKELEHYAS